MKAESAKTIAITDCGSTTTKAILIEERDGVFRQTWRGDAPTTVEAPVEDVTAGVAAAFRDMAAASGRPIVDERGELIRPAKDGRGVDLYLSTSSAGGGLQMAVAGLVRRISVESAERAALGAGAIVAGTIAYGDAMPLHAQVDRIRKLRPDIVLLAGGADQGAEIQILEIAELMAAIAPRSRHDREARLPVLFAGNEAIREKVAAALGGAFDCFTSPNLRPTVDREDLGPARERIHALFLDHVMRKAPGFGRLVEWADAPVVPTPSAVGDILCRAAETWKMSLLAVDIGGATTDLFSVVRGSFNRTVSANLGLSYSATNVLRQSGDGDILRWVPFDLDAETLEDQVMNKTIRPTTIPDSLEELLIEQALARQALALSFAEHRRFASGLKGLGRSRKIDRAFDGAGDGGALRTIDLDLLIGSGGVLSHAPAPAQTAAMLIDGFEPEGVTELAVDRIFMLPHLGVLHRILPGAAWSVFEQDCIARLGTCVAPAGTGRSGRPCLTYALARAGGPTEEGALRFGRTLSLPLGPGEEAELHLRPGRGFDLGRGRGKPWTGLVRGGPVGLVLDGRGRPVAWPEGREARRAFLDDWLAAIGAVGLAGSDR